MMMKFILYLMFMLPYSIMNKYWVTQFFMLLLTFIFCFLGKYSYEWINLSYNFGCDLLSFGLILLSVWICSLMFMSSMIIYEKNNNCELFIFMLLIMMMFLMLTFSVKNLLYFYFFFECSLIPVLFLVMGWGLQLDRIQAGLYLLFYTLFASLPFLLMILYIYLNYNTLSLIMFSENLILLKYLYMYMFMILAFLVKMPMFLLHLWLPKAHVEAPVSGSMILAAVMLKLGGYGLLRVFMLLMKLGNSYNYILMSINLVGGILVSLICLFQVDLKSLIAYSSVVHMSLLLCGVLTMFSWGIGGSFLLMISHGLCSSGLFCLVNIIYERLGSRSILINKGLINFMPSMCLWWFLLCSSNMAAPPSLNLLGEIMLINSLISWSWISMYLIMFLSFFSAFYTLYLYSYTQHGQLNLNLYSVTQGYLREYILLMLHWIPLNLLILNNELFILWK
uniref:NADH-ubiquinone oxidoreductase chain 4 n=1 Tax=Megabeleses liriodendrovorax TaxID=2735432 RepID=A0A8F0WH91_9HYME|nr:NADH dehydrogenase subunit 4 [Megabeleses liriodendrovorax]QWM93819.1 NADH dehydrogenase subunit 4 [Megabeleses liriodendrovorax]